MGHTVREHGLKDSVQLILPTKEANKHSNGSQQNQAKSYSRKAMALAWATFDCPPAAWQAAYSLLLSTGKGPKKGH